MAEVTSLTTVSKQSGSLRITVPHGIVRLLELKPGDKFQWKMKAEEDKIYMRVDPLFR